MASRPVKQALINFDLKPEELEAYLDEYVIGQQEAKAVLATKMCTHFHRVRYMLERGGQFNDTGFVKNNIIMLGPTGVGKTYMVKLVAGRLGVPFVKGDATKFSETGYVGGDVEDLIRDLVHEADGDIERARFGIVYLDEIDKIAAGGRQETGGPGVSRQGVQRDLLPLLEGTTVRTRYGTVSTENILYIAAGAFNMSKPSDLIPELQGRLPIRVELDDLTADDFKRILREPKDALIKQYQALLAVEKVDLRFEDDAVDEIARIAYELNQSTENIGARRLATVMEKLIEDISFSADEHQGETITIDRDYVNRRLAGIVEDPDLSRYIL